MPDDLNIEKKMIPGHVEGIGTSFQITDSDYLNITLDSSEAIKLMLESVPEMITMHIETETRSNSTEITLSGFESNTTYHKYEDHYYNHVEFTTDENGKYTYTQDISKSHIIFIQPKASTYYLIEGGLSTDRGTFIDAGIGIWDSTNRIAMLTTDVNDTIEILIDSVTLDGGGHTLTGPGTTGNGIYLNNRQNVTIENVRITNCTNSIYLSDSTNNTIQNNTIYDNTSCGVGLYFSYDNIIQNNTIYDNASYGVELYFSYDNAIQNNTIYDNNYYGIELYFSDNNKIQCNTIYDNTDNGIYLSYGSSYNTVQYNTIYSNDKGIAILGASSDNSNNNKIEYNTIYGNASYGIRIINNASNNSITNNNFIDRPGYNAYDEGNDNTFNNNYWSDYKCEDTTTYKIQESNADNYPLAAPLLIDTIILLKMTTDNINNKLDDLTSGLGDINNIDSKVDDINNELDDPTYGLNAINNNINNMDYKVNSMDSKVNNIDYKVNILFDLLNNPKVLTTGPVVADENANSLVVQVLNTTGRYQNITVTVYDIKGSPTKVYTATFTFDSKSSCSQFKIFGVPPTQYEVVFKGLESGFYAWTSTRTQNYCASLKYSEFIKANTFRHSELIPIY